MEAEQMELFEELETVDVFVKMTIVYETPSHPGVTHMAHHQFVDQAPDFIVSNELFEAYGGWGNVEIDITHGDLPEPTTAALNHLGVGRLQ